jgi:hypothetical protein
VTLDIDDRGSYFSGMAHVISDNRALPQVSIGIQTADKSKIFKLRTENVTVHDPSTGDLTSWEQIKGKFPENVMVPKAVDVSGEWNDTSLKLSWQTDFGTSGNCILPKSRADQPSDLRALKTDWGEFKRAVSGLTNRRDLFRGQSDRWRLRTTFHRSGRADLLRFLNQDIPTLYRHLSARTRHKFNLKDPDENGAFFNLLQHHGYPTPLLDWSYSPYVAAFFAYRDISRAEELKADSDRCVRIFILDERWRTEVTQILFAARPYPHFSIAEFIAIDNERMIPQQSVSAITNTDDIELYLAEMAIKVGKGEPYLAAIDLPVSQRSMVFADLAHMGVTAGSLFPGLDGTCEELKERHFR